MKIHAFSPDDLAVMHDETMERRKLVGRPIPRKRFGTRMTIALVALRLYVVAAIPLVIYAFARALHAGR